MWCPLQMMAGGPSKTSWGVGGFPTPGRAEDRGLLIVEGPWAPLLVANMMKTKIVESETTTVTRSLRFSVTSGDMDPALVPFILTVIHLLGDSDTDSACDSLLGDMSNVMLTAHQAVLLQLAIESSLADVPRTGEVAGAGGGGAGTDVPRTGEVAGAGGGGAGTVCVPSPSPAPESFSAEVWAKAERVAERWAVERKEELDDIDTKFQAALRLQCGQVPLEDQ